MVVSLPPRRLGQLFFPNQGLEGGPALRKTLFVCFFVFLFFCLGVRLSYAPARNDLVASLKMKFVSFHSGPEPQRRAHIFDDDPLLGSLCPSKSGLMDKHIVKT